MGKLRILVTGIAGFMGSHIAERLVERGYMVWGLDNLVGGLITNIPKKVKNFRSFKPVWLEDTVAVESLVKSIKPDIIHHLACYPYEGLSQFCPVEIAKSVYIGSLNVFKAAVNVGVKRVVYYSSMARYGRGRVPSSEDQPRAAVDVYGASKVASEIALEALSEACGLEYVILVPHNVSGPRMRLDDPYRGVLAIWINSMLQNKPFYIYGDGRQKRAFSHIEDIVEPCIKAGFDDKVRGEIINIGSASVHTLKEVANILKRNYGASFRYVPERPCEVKDAYCTVEKSKKLLDFKDEKTIYDILDDIICYAKEKGVQQFKYRKLEIEKGVPEVWLKRQI